MFKAAPKTVEQIDKDLANLSRRLEQALGRSELDLIVVYEQDIDKLLDLRNAVVNVEATQA